MFWAPNTSGYSPCRGVGSCEDGRSPLAQLGSVFDGQRQCELGFLKKTPKFCHW